MISIYKKVLQDVHSLAKKRHSDYVYNNEKKGSPFLDLRSIKEERDNSQLLQYLNAQDMDTIKIIQTVMYLGRDYVPETEEEYEKRMEYNCENADDVFPQPPLQNANPDELIHSWLISRGHNGWNDKDIEIEQIYQKIPLDKYLERAFEVLGISY